MAPKDFKSKTSRGVKPPAMKQTGWLYFLCGAVSGGALTAFIYINELVPVPLYVAPEKTSNAAPATERATSAAQAPKPRFTFYTMLPEMEVAVPDTELSPANATGAPSPPPTAALENYYLQAGSFRLLEEADKMKANLAFLGLEPSIQTVTINGTDTWHRIRVGPYSDLASLNEARTRLRQNDIETIVLKVRK